MIDILMATNNGEPYIAQQLDSVMDQSYTDWRLIVRDDGSGDNTVTILKKYQDRYPGKIMIVPSNRPSGSAMRNFFKLLDYAESEYIMLSDQDDVWKKDKIEITLSKMQEMENSYGAAAPLLVHTDLCVVDEGLQTINPSLFAMQDLDYRRDQLNHLLVTNIVTGCTVLFNRSLLKLLAEKPEKAVMHDMWIALVAAAFGRIGFVKEATVLYRQHGHNANGAKDVRSFNHYKYKILHRGEITRTLNLQYQQADNFYKIYLHKLTEEQAETVSAYSKFKEKSWLGRAHDLFKYDLKKRGAIHVLGQIFC